MDKLTMGEVIWCLEHRYEQPGVEGSPMGVLPTPAVGRGKGRSYLAKLDISGPKHYEAA